MVSLARVGFSGFLEFGVLILFTACSVLKLANFAIFSGFATWGGLC